MAQLFPYPETEGILFYLAHIKETVLL
jgi:hypothetical protein